MLTFKCDRVPINDFDLSPQGECVGTFTGEIAVEADMGRLRSCSGRAEFRTDEAVKRIDLTKLFADLTADGSRVFCLFNDSNWRE